MEPTTKTKNNTILFACLLICFVVFIFYFHTLNYSWKNYDEHILYEESILPIPHSFSEIFEIISSLGLNNHFESSNAIYSNISNIRGTPADVLFCLFFFWLFKSSSLAYHTFSLILHILNCCLCFFILIKISSIQKQTPFFITRLFLVSFLTLIWALHPVNVEAILLATNFGALVTYFFCFLFFLYFINLIRSSGAIHELPLHHSIGLFLAYLFILFLNEYSITLPFILLFYLLSTSLFHNPVTSFKSTLLIIIKKLTPMFLALFIFVIYFFLQPEIRTTQENSMLIKLERIFWLSPQIFFHYLKLIFHPATLSVDQTALVKLAKVLFDPYAIFCSLFMYALILFSLFSLFCLRKKFWFYFFILFTPYFLSLLPFLHIMSPVYNIASERYLYFPLFFFTFGFSHLLFCCFSKTSSASKPWYTSGLIVLFVILCVFAVRTYIRTLDWKDGFTLLAKAMETAPNNLYKGMREHMAASAINIRESTSEKNPELYYKKAILSLKKAMVYFKKEKRKYQNGTPGVLRFYGLDPKTLLAKTAFLIAFTDIKLSGDPYKAYKIFSPYVNDLPALNTLILDFYYRILFNTKKIDEAEKLLHTALKQNRISPLLFVALSDLSEYKYNDLKSTRKYLHKSFKYFPYDEATLFGLKRLYKKLNKAEEFAFYSYLLGLRTHDIASLQESTLIYIALNKKEQAKIILKKLLNDSPDNANSLQIQMRYKQIFGDLK